VRLLILFNLNIANLLNVFAIEVSLSLFA